MNYEFWIPTVMAVLLALWNFYQQSKIQKLQEKSEKRLHVHKLQFDKEFEIYNDLWSALVQLKNIAIRLRPEVDYYPNDSERTYEEEIRMRLTKTRERGQFIVDLVEKNKPFYPKDIYRELSKLLKLIKKEIISVEYGKKTDSKYWGEGEKKIKEILESMENVCDKIRDRIGVIE